MKVFLTLRDNRNDSYRKKGSDFQVEKVKNTTRWIIGEYLSVTQVDTLTVAGILNPAGKVIDVEVTIT